MVDLDIKKADFKKSAARLERLHNEIREIYDIDLREEDEEDYKK